MKYHVDRISPSEINVCFTLNETEVALLYLERKANLVSFDVTVQELFGAGQEGHASFSGGVAITGENVHVVAYWLDKCKLGLS